MLLDASLNILGTEWLWIVFLVVFLLFGSQKLPELSRALGKAMGELQRGRAEVEREFRAATAASYLPPNATQQHTRSITTAPAPAPSPTPEPAPTTPTTDIAAAAAPAQAVTASTAAPIASSEKVEPLSKPRTKRPRAAKGKKKQRISKTSGQRKKKDNSPLK